jgi:phosphoribosyl 1,2-cyclic phosphate phosphodiesterase
MNLEEALALIEKLKPEKTWLTHISHMMGLSQKVAKQLPANVCMAYDGLDITIE